MGKQFFKTIYNNFLDDLFPEGLLCLNCSEELNNGHFLCKHCLKTLTYIDNRCKKCGKPVNDSTDYCDDCINQDRFFDLAFSPLEYSGVAKTLIYKLKYDEQKYVAKVFGKMLAKCFYEQNLSVDLVTVVPLSKKRKKMRRYNQAEVLCDEFLKELENLGVKLQKNYNLVERVRNTLSQTLLTKDERLKNLKGAFKISCDKNLIKDKSILIIDDIFTTGATMEEISKVFKKAKALKIYCLTVCHTKLNRDKNK